MDQKKLSPLSDFPEELLKKLFGFFHVLTLVEITRVNIAWYTIAMSCLPPMLFEYYKAKTDVFSEGRLLSALCDWYEASITLDITPFFEDYQLLFQTDLFSEDAFSDHQQKLFFKKFVLDVFKEQGDGSESLLQITKRAYQENKKADTDDQRAMIKSSYFEKHFKDAEEQVNFLFNTLHIQRFLRFYNPKTKTSTSTNEADDLFIAKYLYAVQQLESFLSTIVLFFRIQKVGDKNHAWQLLKDPYARNMLMGDGLVLLSSNYFDLIGELISKSLSPNKGSSHLTLEEAYIILTKLRPIDLISYASIATYEIKNAISAEQPQIIALLANGSVDSDTALIHIFNATTVENFLNMLEPIPKLVLRLNDPFFLNRFLNSLKDDWKKSRIAEDLLSGETFVKGLQEPELIFLTQYLCLYEFDDLAKILQVLSKAHKLTGSLLLAFAKRKVRYYVGNFALFIAEDANAQKILAQKENAVHAFEIIKILITSEYTKNRDCELLADPTLMQNLTFEQLRELYGSLSNDALYAEERRVKQDCLQKHYIEKLANEPNDQTFIDALFAKLSATFLKENPAVYNRLKNIQNIQYLYQQSVHFCTKETEGTDEKQTKKKIVLSFLISAQFLSHFTDSQLIWVAEPACHEQGSFYNLFELLFDSNRMTKDLFLQLIQLPNISKMLCYSIKSFVSLGKEALQKLNTDLAFEFANYVLGFAEDSVVFLSQFQEMLQKFSPAQRIVLLEGTQSKMNQQHLQTYLTFEELRTSTRQLKSKIPDNHREAFFVNRLAQEKSPETFATEVANYGMQNTKSWAQKYAQFSTRLQQADIYPLVFGKCIALLVTDNLKPSNPTIVNWLELLVFLKCPPTFDAPQKHAILRQYTSQQIYTCCIQLRTIEDKILSASLQTLFYPLCFDLLHISHLQQLKTTFSSNTLKDILWPNPLTNTLEEQLAAKIKKGSAPSNAWRYAITSRQFNVALLLLFIGAAMLIPGIILHLIPLWVAALAPMASGIGLLAIPLIWTFINRVREELAPQKTVHQSSTSGEQTPLLNCNLSNTPSSTQLNPIPYQPLLQPEAPKTINHTPTQTSLQTNETVTHEC